MMQDRLNHMKPFLLLGTTLITCMFLATRQAEAALEDSRVVRLAELTIDPMQLEAYRTALKEEIEASIRVEPGVLTLNAVAVKGHPEQIRIFETYRDQAAYEAHLQTAHFKKYKAATQGMVKSLKLVETEPILLGAK
jgi:quinol monooxygenase YgiN